MASLRNDNEAKKMENVKTEKLIQLNGYQNNCRRSSASISQNYSMK